MEVSVIAHRGASRDCPENTLPAFDEALRQGCDGIELDVQLSRDGVPVVYHDRSLRKAGAGLRRVASLTLDELRRLDAGGWFGRGFSGARIPALAEVLERYASRTLLLLEIKLRGGREWQLRLARAVAEMVRERRLEERTLLLCYDGEVLREAARRAPGARRVLNLAPPPRLDAATRRLLQGLHAISADVRRLTPAFAASMRDAGLPLYTFTCNTAPLVERSLAAGAAGVMSDRPGWLAALLGRRGRDR